MGSLPPATVVVELGAQKCVPVYNRHVGTLRLCQTTGFEAIRALAASVALATVIFPVGQ